MASRQVPRERLPIGADATPTAALASRFVRPGRDAIGRPDPACLTAGAMPWHPSHVAAPAYFPDQPDHVAVFADPARYGVRLVDDQVCVEDASLAEIAEVAGTPTYIYSTAHIGARFDALATACTSHPTLLCYAVKANANPAVLRILGRRGAGMDIVSGGELALALAAGIDPSKIVFSGVGKLDHEIDAAIAAGVRSINIESAEELERVAARARALGRPASISLRVNPDIDPETHPYLATGLRDSKFGIDMTEALPLAQRAVAAAAHLKLVGLACHIGSQIFDAAPYLAAAGRLGELVAALRSTGVQLQHLDLGGGLGSPYTPEDPDVDVANFGQAVTQVARDLGVHLILEPGRYVVGNAGILLTQVIGRKVGGTRKFVIVDAAMNDLVRPALYSATHLVIPVSRTAAGEPPHRADIVGPVCECGDFLAQDRLVPWPSSGALLAVLSAGAYGMTMASTYNSRPLPAEVLVHGEHFEILRPRRAPSIADVTLPAWL